MCLVFELEGFMSLKICSSTKSPLAQNLCTFWHNDHKLGRLPYAKSFQNLQKYCNYLILDMSYAKSSKGLKKCRDSATVPNRIWIFYFFLSEHILWTKGHLWVPQAWSSVNPLAHKKTVPLKSHFSVCRTWQYLFALLDFSTQNLDSSRHFRYICRVHWWYCFIDLYCKILCNIWLFGFIVFTVLIYCTVT